MFFLDGISYRSAALLLAPTRLLQIPPFPFTEYCMAVSLSGALRWKGLYGDFKSRGDAQDWDGSGGCGWLMFLLLVCLQGRDLVLKYLLVFSLRSEYLFRDFWTL